MLETLALGWRRLVFVFHTHLMDDLMECSFFMEDFTHVEAHLT